MRCFGVQGGPVGDHRCTVNRTQFGAAFQLCKVSTQPIGRCLDIAHFGMQLSGSHGLLLCVGLHQQGVGGRLVLGDLDLGGSLV